MKNKPKDKDPLKEELDANVMENQEPEIQILKGKKRGHIRDGCNGGGGAVGGGVGGGGLGGGISLALAALAGDPPGPDFAIVKAARDIPLGAIIKDKDLEDISAKEYKESGGKISKDMVTRSMAKNMSATANIRKGTFLKLNLLTNKVTPIH